jgi:tetratricopeptide (TPR) repeat protein
MYLLGSMLGTRMICGIYAGSKRGIKSCYYAIRNLPFWYKSKIKEFKYYIATFKYRLSHLSETNLELGMHHLHKQNINDAIIRFTLVDKFLNPNDRLANYWLGWCYFLKNNYKKAIYHLQKASYSDQVKLGQFLENYSNYVEIPAEIWRQYRDFTAQYYPTSFRSDTINLPYSFIQKTMDKIVALPDSYSILELNSNIGLAGYEIRKRFPDSFTLTAIENSSAMNDLVNLYYPKLNIYDQLINSPVKDFLHNTQNKFDVILSFCGLSFTKDLKHYFECIYNISNNDGYFAFCLPVSKKTELSLKRKEFVFNSEEIKAAIDLSKFTTLGVNELSLGINNKYSIFICRKLVK